MTEAPKYEIKTTEASVGAKKIQLTNRTPVFSEEASFKCRKQGLFRSACARRPRLFRDGGRY